MHAVCWYSTTKQLYCGTRGVGVVCWPAEVAHLRERLLQRSSQSPPKYSNSVQQGETAMLDYKLKWANMVGW